METICDKRFSKNTVSEACKELDEKVKQFRERLLTGDYPFFTIDATYFEVRENSRVLSKALMIAYATNSEGHREIIGFGIYRKESKETWNGFLKGLKACGLTGVRMITSDAYERITDASSKQFPDVPWQRCQFHFKRNITQKTAAKYQKGLASELQEMFNCKTIEEARKRRDETISDYRDVAEEAMTRLDQGFEEAMTVKVLPGYLHKYFRTSNQIERLKKGDRILFCVNDIFLQYDDAQI